MLRLKALGWVNEKSVGEIAISGRVKKVFQM